MNSGNGVITDRGILFVDRERPMEQQYSGSTFPQFLDDPHCFMIAQIYYQGQTEYANLPVEKLALEKAMRRLGAPSMSACQITLDHMDQSESAFHRICDLTLLRDGVYMVNHWLQAIDSYVSPENHMVFDAAFAASGMKTMQDAVKVAENIGSFYFAKDVKNDADLGKWWLEHYTKFTISPELQQFFDYRAYGEHLSQFLDVHYLECGDCVFLDGTTMDEVLGIVPGEEMKMGGM